MESVPSKRGVESGTKGVINLYHINRVAAETTKPVTTVIPPNAMRSRM